MKFPPNGRTSFIAHMDTSPDMSGENVKPRIVEKYDGKDIPLCAEENIILSPANFPELLDHVGEDLIVTDEVIEAPTSLVIPEAANREISATVVLKRMLEGLE